MTAVVRFVTVLSSARVISYTRSDGGTRISGRSVFVRDENRGDCWFLFTTASKPIRNTKNLAIQVEKTRFRFQKVLASTKRRDNEIPPTSSVREWLFYAFYASRSMNEIRKVTSESNYPLLRSREIILNESCFFFFFTYVYTLRGFTK